MRFSRLSAERPLDLHQLHWRGRSNKGKGRGERAVRILGSSSIRPPPARGCPRVFAHLPSPGMPLLCAHLPGQTRGSSQPFPRLLPPFFLRLSLRLSLFQLPGNGSSSSQS